MEYLSDYGRNDEVYDPNVYVLEMANNMRRDAEGLKLDGKHSHLGLQLLHAADALEDLLGRNEFLLDKLIAIEDLVARALRNG